MSNSASCTQPLFHPAMSGLDLSSDVWFDDWSDGPFNLHTIITYIAQKPALAHRYHVMGRCDLTYAFLFPDGFAITTDPR